jgi:hypothetical protein
VGFDTVTETAISAVAASVISQRLLPHFGDQELSGFSLPLMFHELWEIHTAVDSRLLPKTLKKFQNPEYEVPDCPEDMWIAFVRELSRTGIRNFIKLLERARPIPLNVAVSLQDLPPYDPKT